MNAIGYNVLTTNSRKEISLNAEPLDLDRGIRPEIIIPLDVSGGSEDASQTIEDFAPGHKVRISRSPHMGRIGTIRSLSRTPAVFPSGIRAFGADVILENDERTTVPLANLERVV